MKYQTSPYKPSKSEIFGSFNSSQFRCNFCYSYEFKIVERFFHQRSFGRDELKIAFSTTIYYINCYIKKYDNISFFYEKNFSNKQYIKKQSLKSFKINDSTLKTKSIEKSVFCIYCKNCRRCLSWKRDTIFPHNKSRKISSFSKKRIL